MRGGKMKKSSGPRRNRKEHRDRKEKRMSRHGGTSAPIHMSASDRKYMKDFGELHPIHEKTDDDGDASVKRKKIDFTKPEPRRHPHEKAKPGSRHGAIEVKEVEKGDAEDDYEEFAEGNTAYSALLSTIRPRGRFAAILQSMKEDEAQEEEDKEEEDEDDEDDEEESQSGDDDSSQEEDEDANSLEDGDDVSNSNDDDDDEDDEDDDEDDEDDESEDGVMTSDPEEAEAEAEAGADEPQEKESESEGVARNAALHDHFDQAFDDKTAPKFAKFLQSMQSGKEKKESIELQSPSFETAILHSGYGAYKRAINSLPSSTPATKLRPNLRWWARKNEKTPKPDEISNVDFSPMQSELFSMMDSYKDVYLPQWSHENADEIRESYVIHALNHALKVRNIVQKNDERIKAAQASGRDCEVQDSGFTRPRVLIVVPYRFCAFKIVNMMIRLLVDPNAPKVERSVKSQNRFKDEFGVDPEEEAPTNELLAQQFDGNADDCFRVGITLNNKSLNLYTKLNFSDIIIASPLGLRLMMGADNDKKKPDIDFLSSIEMMILDQTDCLLMQNWAHVQHLMESLNQIPKAQHEVDISRIRRWALEGWAKYFRQTILISSHPAPEFSALMNRLSFNLFGKVVCTRSVEGTICQVVRSVPQVFHRFSCDRPAEQSATRLAFFLEEILPKFGDVLHNRTMIFIPSYFDFVRVRNHFRTEKMSFSQICEYTPSPHVVRARSHFYHAQRHYLLYTERFHYHHRSKIRGLRHVIFYGLPHFAGFYSELLNMMESDTDVSCTILYHKFDAVRLEQVVGSARVQDMLSSQKATHLYM